MPNIWSIAFALIAAIAAPKPYRFSFLIDVPSSLDSDKPRIIEALHRGLLVDSLIVEGPRRPPFDPSAPRDSAKLAGLSETIVVRGSVRDAAGVLEVRLELKNVLARVIAGPDTLRVAPAALDSALSAQGRRYAKFLAERRR